MSDISHTLIAKSDQLNAADLFGSEKLLTITSVDVKKSGEQPVVIHYEGENGRPWKPCLTVRRILAALYGSDSKKWIGQTVAVFADQTVVYAGEENPGIRPKAATGIDSTQIIKLKERRGPKPKTFEIQPLRIGTKQGAKTATVNEYSFEKYERFILDVVNETDPEKMEARFERAKDWRLKAVAENRERATELRELYDEALAKLTA